MMRMRSAAGRKGVRLLMHWGVAAGVAALLAGCGASSTKTVTVTTPATATATTAGSTTAAARPAADASCATDAHAIETAGYQGPYHCKASGIPTVLVGPGVPMQMSSMTVRFVSKRVTKTVTNSTLGQSASAQGMFVIVTVTITNNTQMPQLFNQDSQTVLQIGNSSYSISSKGDETDTGSDGWTNEINPGEHATGDLIYDVPSATVASEYPTHAGVAFVNFGEFLSAGSASQLGILSLG
jgi:hypothetical protein